MRAASDGLRFRVVANFAVRLVAHSGLVAAVVATSFADVRSHWQAAVSSVAIDRYGQCRPQTVQPKYHHSRSATYPSTPERMPLQSRAPRYFAGYSQARSVKCRARCVPFPTIRLWPNLFRFGRAIGTVELSFSAPMIGRYSLVRC